MTSSKKHEVSFTPSPPIFAAIKREADAMGCTVPEFMKGFLFQAAREPGGATLRLSLESVGAGDETPLLPLSE